MKLNNYFKLDRKPAKGLFAIEYVIMAYLVLTTLFIFFTYVKLPNPESMLWLRFRALAITVALWAVYRMLPCPLTRFFRIAAQMLMLSLWYPDTYELNRILPNLDHIAASAEQSLFGCQPALLFSQHFPSAFFGELMCFGYSAYYPMIGLVMLFYFFFRYADFMRASFVILASFFAYYVIFIFLPVVGPQYYYPAVGLDQVAAGTFPNLHDYFLTLRSSLDTPGSPDGFFHQMVAGAHQAGERPTAAFPSSHVGISSILMFLAWQTRNRWIFWCLVPVYVLLCLSTVYIYAHYAIDVLAGFISAAIFFLLLHFGYKKFVKE